ncbi:uncharacterized protein LOC128988701 isoform X2 [Macrosteles quadrilineatus]|uniref:uncharacterized protein LOC128988701 isoform X2 n=1 Tax=Macrosteles quadrilineatus TaxID=74068 RepID=UPI0023E0F321|nr:uncharacterized protein LOC128988701 isoform X2 [Macrosteles quadrilineatus]
MGNCLSTCAKSSETSQGATAQTGEVIELNTTEVQVVGEDKVRELVQQELRALQHQISHSQAVLAKLHFRFSDEIISDTTSDLAKVHRTTQTSNPDNLPKSLECVAVGLDKGWEQITSSCPAIVNIAVQTDDETTSKSNGTSGDYFLPPISPLGSQISESECAGNGEDVASKLYEPRPLGHMDLDIYRSCRKLSVLPEEEVVPDEFSPPSAGCRLAASPHYPHQAHSFESYLLPVSSPSVRRQLSDPTPSPDIHPASRRSSRSTSRPLQLQPEIFRFPDIKPESPSKEAAPKSPPCVKFQNPLENIKEDFPRITSPTYNILQDTVSHLITMSNEYLDTQPEDVSGNKKDSLTIPGYYTFTPDGSTPYKTPPDNSVLSTPGFFTPQETSERRPSDSIASSCFHTPASASPVTNPTESSKSTSSNGNSAHYKTPPDVSQGTSYQSSYSSPLYMSPLAAKRAISKQNNENNFTEVPDLKNIRTSTLYVKPLPGDFDPNRTMLSILLDEPRVQKDNTNSEAEEIAMPFISFTSLDIQFPSPEVPSSCVSPTDTSLSPTSEGLARTPSRRRLQRSLVRISSETPLELVPVEASVTSPSADVPAATETPVSETQNHDSTIASPDNSDMKQPEVQEGSMMRRTNSDVGAGGLASVCALTASNSFPSLSDTVLRQLGALMDEVRQSKEENQSTETDIESKFTSLMLAFKTDKLTLERRTELQRRLRDQAEQNMAAELAKLKLAIQMLSPLCTDSEKIELLEKVSEQADALHKSTTRVSTSAEMFGAVQQENRLSKAVDIVLRHVENLKQAYEKERTEHEETRKILSDNKLPSNAVLKLQNSKRRASIATLTRAQTSPDPNRSPSIPGENRTVSRARLGSLPRKLSNTILEAEPEETSNKETSAVTNSGGSQPRDVVEGSSINTRTLQRKPSRQAILEERRQSQTPAVVESESEDEGLSMEPGSDTETPPPVDTTPTIIVNRRVSLQAPWLSVVKDWVRPGDHTLLQLRYSVAVALLVAALAVFTSTFIPRIS